MTELSRGGVQQRAVSSWWDSTLQALCSVACGPALGLSATPDVHLKFVLVVGMCGTYVYYLAPCTKDRGKCSTVGVVFTSLGLEQR